MKTILFILANMLMYISYSQTPNNSENTKTSDSISSNLKVEKKITTISSKVQDVFDVIIDELIKTDEKKTPKRITFLIEVASSESLVENKILLKQGIKILAKKLANDDQIALVTYGRSSKIVLNHTLLANKSILIESINNINAESIQVNLDGIDKAYQIAEDNYNDKGENIVVLLRDDTKFDIVDMTSTTLDSLTLQKAQIKKQKNATILVTALSLLPEIIRIIK